MTVREQLERLWQNLLGLGGKRLAAMGIVGLAVFLSIGFGSYYLSRPETDALYTGLSPQDVTRIGAVLRDAGIPFDVSTQGTAVLVRRGQAAQARMLLAEKGLPSGATSGYELFDKMGSVGLTSFMQEVTKVRVLEGELARTIQGMKGIRAARVHIVLPEAGSFRRARQAPSASVIIRTHAVADYTSATAVRHLVAAAVPELTVDRVTVLDTDGTVLTSGGDNLTATPGKMRTLERSIGDELRDSISKTLVPILGLSNFEVSVAARLNTDRRQINETTFNPETRVERSVRVTKETGSAQSTNTRAGVSVDQNVPADTTSTASGGDQSKKANERREELTNYEVGSKTIATVSEGYKVEALTVAVVINRKRLLSLLGEGASQEAIDKQIKEVERIVASAAGVDPKRGDRVTVATLDFVQAANELEPAQSAGILQELLSHTGSLLSGMALIAATTLLILFAVRPAIRVLQAQEPAAAAARKLAAAPQATEASNNTLGAPAEPVPNLISDLTSKLNQSPQRRLEQMVDLNEEQAALILRSWVRGAAKA